MNSKVDIEMKEIKVSKGKALLQFLCRHIVAVYLVVILAILLFGNIAKAESMPSNIVEYLEEDFNRNFSSWRSYESQINNITSVCPYFVRYYVTIANTQYAVYDFFTFENLGINSIFINNYFYSGGYPGTGSGCIYTLDSSFVLPSTGNIGYRILSRVGNGSLYCILWFSASSTSNVTSVFFSNARFYNGSYGDITVPISRPNGNNFSVDYSSYISYGDCYINYSSNLFYLASNTSPLYTEDERLKLYKLWSSQNGDSLVLDLSDFRTYTAAAAYNFSNINVTLSTNGVETVYSLPLVNSSVNDGWDNQSNLYTVSTPLSDFTLSDAYDTYVTKVSFDMVTSSPGGTLTQTFYVSTNFPLDLHHSAVTPEAIPTPATIYEDPAKPIDISDRKYDYFQQLQSSVSGGDIDFVSSYPVLPTWANVYELNTFFDVDSGVDDLHIYLGSVILGKYRLDNNYDFDLKAFIYDNAHSQFYDVIVIRLDQTDWPAVVNANTLPETQDFYGYVVLYTDSYYLRLDAETQFNILEALQLDANQQLANWNWLVTKLDDFELKTTQILNPLYDEVSYVDDKLASILYAVNSIEAYNDSSVLAVLGNIYDAITGIGGTDTSNIETKLDTLINHFIANNSQENSAYKQFVTWLRDVNGKPVQYVSTGYEFFTELFDYFPFTRDLDGSGGFSNMFDMGKGFIDISTGHTTGIPENYQGLSYYFNSANDGTYNVQSMSGR